MTLHAWFYRFVRKRSPYIPENQALVWKRRLSIMYGVLAWHAFGIIVYMCYNGKGDWAHYHGLKSDEEKAIPPGQSYAQMLGIPNAKVYRIAGAKVVDQYDIVEGKEEGRTGDRNNTQLFQG